MKTLPSPRRFPQARRFCLLAVLMSFALNLCAQSGGTVRYDLGMFTIELPEESREIDSEEARQEGCLGWVTPGKDFVCAICFFRFDEGFNPETRFQEEADGLKFDLENSERFMITTGTEQVLRCALIRRSESVFQAIALYPDFGQKRGTFMCLSTVGHEEPDLLAYILSSFRLNQAD